MTHRRNGDFLQSSWDRCDFRWHSDRFNEELGCSLPPDHYGRHMHYAAHTVSFDRRPVEVYREPDPFVIPDWNLDDSP